VIPLLIALSVVGSIAPVEQAPSPFVDDSGVAEADPRAPVAGLSSCALQLCCGGLNVLIGNRGNACDFLSDEAKFLALFLTIGAGVIGLVAGGAVATAYAMTRHGGSPSGDAIADDADVLFGITLGVAAITAIVGALIIIPVVAVFDIACIAPSRVLFGGTWTEPIWPRERRPHTAVVDERTPRASDDGERVTF